MKKILLSVCAAVLVAGLASSSFAAETAQMYRIYVNINSADIDLTGASDYSWGAIAPGTDSYSNDAQGQPRATVTQAGYATIDLNASYYISATGTAWTANDDDYTTSPAMTVANNVRIAGIFTAPLNAAQYAIDDLLDDGVANLSVNADYYLDVDNTHFADDDILPAGAAFTPRASTTVLARTGEQAQFLGSGVTPANNTRNLRFRVDAPPAGSSTDTQTIHIIIQGQI